MNLNAPFNNHGLKDSELALLRKGNFQTIADLLLMSTQDIAKRCKSSPLEIKRIVDVVLGATPWPALNRVTTFDDEEDESFTTGDVVLDKALGGGVRTGMVWEIVGESSAGKTQLALQLSLFVQAPRESGGLAACVCYLTTSSKLPTNRLVQMSELNSSLSSADCGLEHVHTIAVPTVAMLQHVLSTVFPSFVASNPGGRKIKLLVIDALGELFHSDNKTTTSTLVERSKDIFIISASLHELASQRKIAIVVLNEVIDTFDRPHRQCWDGKDLLYDYQSRWFNTAEFFSEGKKQASLGLVWANQVNTRIILSRTGKRRYLNKEDLPKRLRLNNRNLEQPTDRQVVQGSSQPDLIRRLSVIFSNVTSPVSLEYIVSEQGICVLGDEDQVLWTADRIDDGQAMQMGEKSPIERPSSETALDPKLPIMSEVGKPSGKHIHVGLQADEFENSLWSTTDSYGNLDWDVLEERLSNPKQ